MAEDAGETRHAKIYSALAHPLRQRLIRALARDGKLTFTQMLEEGRVEPGTLGHHLRKLGDLVEQDREKSYRLTKEGYLAYKILEKSVELEEDKDLTPDVVNNPEISRFIFGLYVSIIIFIIFVSVISFPHLSGVLEQVAWIGVFTFGFGLILYTFIKLIKTSYVIRGDSLIVDSAFAKRTVNIGEIDSMRRTLIPLGIRLFGASLYSGHYYFPGLGRARLAMTNFKDGVLIRTKKGETLIITPSEPEEFMRVIQRRMR
ncbi:MAG: PH domain-containing protein [Candidatus Geothermarchaeales archaeon]